MAITVNIDTVTFDTPVTTGTITDSSVYTSPTRAAVGVYVQVYKTDYRGARQKLVTTGNGVDPPDDDTIWTFPYDSDGYHEILYVAIPDYAAGTYNLYDAVYSPANNWVFRSKIGSNNNSLPGSATSDANWEYIAEPYLLADNDGLATESTNITSQVLRKILYPATKICFGDQAGEAALEGYSTATRRQDVQLYEFLGLCTDAMKIAENRQEYTSGEKIARRAAAACAEA
jgi:hypothetical protein